MNGRGTPAKIIDSPVLNAAGLQVVRTVTAHVIQRMVRKAEPLMEFRRELERLRTDGFTLIPSFLPPDLFRCMQQEAADAATFLRPSESSLDTQSAPLSGLPVRRFPHLLSILIEPQLRHICACIEGPWSRAFHFARLEVVTQSARSDEQHHWHTDTFHHSHKSWLFLSSVGLDDGCLAYMKGSHRLRLRQLPGIYRHSRQRSADSSRRITPRELDGHREERIVCRENTLLIVDTHGYHRRVPGTPQRRRVALQVSFRMNPFQWLTPALLATQARALRRQHFEQPVG